MAASDGRRPQAAGVLPIARPPDEPGLVLRAAFFCKRCKALGLANTSRFLYFKNLNSTIMRALIQYPIEWWEGLLGLFYPNLCLACGKGLRPRQEPICPSCQYKLPKTDFHKEEENPFTERFWGRIPLHSGAALYHFTKGGRTQQLIHKLKYEGKREIGLYLGRMYGHSLRETPLFRGVQLILPVPLHRRKAWQRGYNQSALFARGLAESMAVPWLEDGLQRTEYTSTQTRKDRLERFHNVEKAFRIPHPERLRGKHILLVDDVITTGATLEACAIKMLEVPGTKVSMATIAIAD